MMSNKVCPNMKKSIQKLRTIGDVDRIFYSWVWHGSATLPPKETRNPPNPIPWHPDDTLPGLLRLDNGSWLKPHGGGGGAF